MALAMAIPAEVAPPASPLGAIPASNPSLPPAFAAEMILLRASLIASASARGLLGAVNPKTCVSGDA